MKDALRCVIRKMQIKPRYHYTSIRMGKTWDSDDTELWQRYETIRILIHTHRNAKWYS